LRRLGKVLHLSKSGNLILRLEGSQLPSEKATVCDYKLARIGTVNGILGPVKSPYVSVHPTVESGDTLKGRVLYLVENGPEHR
jgi:rRNA processing protein Gar1